MKMENKEFTRSGEVFIRSLNEESADSRIVAGYAVKFESMSQYMGYYEIIKKGAITEDTIMQSDIFALFNHDTNAVLARSRYGEGSLALELRDDGLYYEFEAPNTMVGDELLEHLKRGEMSTSSFAFTLPEDGSGEHWYKDDEGNLIREITHIDRLYDVSPVYEPAYLATTCSKRAIDKVKSIEDINNKLDSMLNELDEFIIK